MMLAVGLIINFNQFFVKAETNSVLQNARIETSGVGTLSKVAPGDSLPISVKLLNFGGGKKVDVIITYSIFDLDKKDIYSTTETVAVETTASFIKNIQVPSHTSPGRYVAKALITYQDQVAPAITEFPFTVENKLFGLFQSDLILLGFIALLASIFLVTIGYILFKKYRTSRYKFIEYSNVPSDIRVFYELVSDTILQMRMKVGDKALDIASHVDGLEVDQQTGKVLRITKSPSRVIASLVSAYEKLLNQKVSFSFRKNK